MKTQHPKGLFLLFFVEMWERFSFYGMRALLVLYMVKALAFDTQHAGSVYGWYTGLVYLSPLVGGYIADRYLGPRMCVTIGGLLMALGHFVMALPPLPFFYSALLLIIVGNGFFKPNISTIVGTLYERNDPRRDGGFTIFYMGINLGAFFSPLVCGYLGEKVGWHYGFAAAGVGMVLGLLLYKWGQKRLLGDRGLHPAKRTAKADGTDKPLTRVEKERIGVIFVLVFFVIFFWAAFEQAGSSMTLFADRSTDRFLFGWEVPASFFQSVNPLFIILLAPLFSKLWLSLARAGREPSLPLKFVLGLAALSAGFVFMIGAAALYQHGGAVSMFWLLGVYAMHTVGELCLSPVGLSAVTKLSPAKFGSLLMGTWFLSNAVANLFGGLFAGRYDSMDHALFFLVLAAVSGAAALVLFFLVPTLKRWMHGVR